LIMKIKVKKIHHFRGHRDSIYALAKSDSPNVFFSSGGDGLVVKWDLNKNSDGKVLAKLENSVYAMHYHPGKGLLIIGQNNEGLHFIDPTQRKAVKSLKITDSFIFDINSVGELVYVACGDGRLAMIDLNEFSIKGSIQISHNSLRSIAVNHEGSNIVIGSSDNHIYNYYEGELLSVPAHKNSVFKVAFSKDGQTLLSGSRDAHLNFWTGHRDLVLEESIPAHMFTINDIHFRSDNMYFATASKDKTLKIWDFKERKLLKVIDHARHGGHISSVNKLIWINNKNRVVSASDDRTICVWDLELND